MPDRHELAQAAVLVVDRAFNLDEIDFDFDPRESHI
jgi:hypothetical protein